MKKAIIFGMAGTALIIGAVAYILRKVEDSQNRNDMNLSDLDDFEIAEDEDEESEEDDDDEVEADSDIYVKVAKSIMNYLEETGCVERYQKGRSRKLNHNKLKELLNQLDDNCTKCEA